jgi:hypothetical protein
MKTFALYISSELFYGGMMGKTTFSYSVIARKEVLFHKFNASKT